MVSSPNTITTDLAGDLVVYCVYFSPLDYPGKWVVRKWTVTDHNTVVAGEQPLVVADDIEAARLAIAKVMPGAFRLKRHDYDDPRIWETWQ